MWSIVPSILILGTVAIIAARLAMTRDSPVTADRQRHAAAFGLLITTAIQGVHFLEEWLTGFAVRFPALLGLEPMPLSFFVPFNFAWLAVWLVSFWYLRRGTRAAFFAAWFLALAGTLNGIAHPMMALSVGGYFPGLYSSPAIGLAGILLFRQLLRAAPKPAG